MKAILHGQGCSGFEERAKGAVSIDEVWAREVAHHKAIGKRWCDCQMLDTDKGQELAARWGTGVFTLEDGKLVCVASDWDSSD